jgi:MFS family permease
MGLTKNKSLNIPVMYASTTIGGMLFFLPVLALYFESRLFTATNVAMVFSIEAFCLVIFEIPTGAVADLFGRKRTLILSRLADLSGLTFLYFAKSMPMFAGYAFMNALARSLNSGTENAIIYDTLKGEGQEQQYKKAIGIYQALWPLGASAGSIIGGYMAKNSIQSSVLWSFAPVLVTLVLTCFLKEPDYQKAGHRKILEHMGGAVKTICGNRQLSILVLASLIMVSLGESVHYLSPLFYSFKQLPIQYFGYVSAAVYGLSSLGHYYSHSFSKLAGDKAALIVAAIASPVLTLAATLLSGAGSIALFVLPSICFGLKNPVMDHMINREVPSSQRATVLSANSFAGQLGIAAAAPVFGAMTQSYNINRSVQISALVLLIVPLWLAQLSDKTGNKNE